MKRIRKEKRREEEERVTEKNEIKSHFHDIVIFFWWYFIAYIFLIPIRRNWTLYLGYVVAVSGFECTGIMYTMYW